MHFAVGMACGGAIGAAGCAIARRGWRWLPLAMTAGGIWANVPDMPRFWRVDFPWLPLGRLGDMEVERALHAWGDVFFFHHTMDLHWRGLALPGLFLILFFYNVALVVLIITGRRAAQRAGRAERILQSHGVIAERRLASSPSRKAA